MQLLRMGAGVSVWELGNRMYEEDWWLLEIFWELHECCFFIYRDSWDDHPEIQSEMDESEKDRDKPTMPSDHRGVYFRELKHAIGA